MGVNKCYRAWSKSEDDIISLLRKDIYSIRDISYGLFHRSRSATANRMLIIRRYQRDL